mgnify:CR=1 FL=1
MVDAVNKTLKEMYDDGTIAKLCEKWGVPVEERRISVEEIVEAGIRYVKEKKIPPASGSSAADGTTIFSRSPAF